MHFKLHSALNRLAAIEQLKVTVVVGGDNAYRWPYSSSGTRRFRRHIRPRIG
jgi:hypothetical protein